MVLKNSLVFIAALAAATVSGAPAFQVRDTSSGYALFNSNQAADILSKVQSAYAAQNASAVNAIAAAAPYPANNQTGTTSSATLIKYARYAGAAYKVRDKSWTCMINCWSSDTKGTVVDYHWDVSGVPSYGFVAHKDDTKEIIVSWRGSTILMDWIADLTFVPVPWPKQVDGSAVHVGFLSAYSAAADKIKSVVAGLVQKYPDYKIVLTGHSLGGAEAAVGAADFAVTHPEWVSKMELYTYGEPRVGNPSFAAWMSKQPFPIYRVVNKGDLVPQVPLQVMGFEQHSQEVWYTPSGKTQFCGSDGENKACQDSLGPLQLSILDHLGYPGLSYQLLYWAIGNIEAII